MATISLFWDTNVADVTPCENSLLGNLRLCKDDIVFVPTASILEGVDHCRTLANHPNQLKVAVSNAVAAATLADLNRLCKSSKNKRVS